MPPARKGQKPASPANTPATQGGRVRKKTSKALLQLPERSRTRSTSRGKQPERRRTPSTNAPPEGEKDQEEEEEEDEEVVQVPGIPPLFAETQRRRDDVQRRLAEARANKEIAEGEERIREIQAAKEYAPQIMLGGFYASPNPHFPLPAPGGFPMLYMGPSAAHSMARGPPQLDKRLEGLPQLFPRVDRKYFTAILDGTITYKDIRRFNEEYTAKDADKEAPEYERMVLLMQCFEPFCQIVIALAPLQSQMELQLAMSLSPPLQPASGGAQTSILSSATTIHRAVILQGPRGQRCGHHDV
ncbi:MAG: hypothetical protein Q9182_007633 [Xanthomendoza sp. 2 TL-2023]